jgi:hypothetical protein
VATEPRYEPYRRGAIIGCADTLTTPALDGELGARDGQLVLEPEDREPAVGRDAAQLLELDERVGRHRYAPSPSNVPLRHAFSCSAQLAQR